VESLRGPSNRRSYTRTQATSLSFSWRGRLAWSAPPILFLLWLMSGSLSGFGPLVWFIGVVMVGFTIWWLRQVWTRIALPAAAPPDPSRPVELIEPRPGPPHLTG
jgi:Na+/melibiose symporter-like transporter